MWLLNTLVILSVLAVIYGETEVIIEDEVKTEDAVLILTIDDFESVIEDNEFVLVEFYDPSCGHCQSLAPEYVKAAKELEEKGSIIKLGKVDAIEETELFNDFGGYATLKLFRNGTPIEYTGVRHAEHIVNWLNKKTRPAAVDLETVDAAEEFFKSQPVVLIGFFEDRESAEAKTFLSVADAVDEYSFGITSNEDVYAKYEAKSGSIILFKSFDEGKAVFNGESTEEAIKKFLTVESMPLIIEFTFASAQKFFGGDIKIHLLMFVSKEAGHIEKYTIPAKDLAKQFKNEVLFISVNTDVEDHQRLLTYFGIKKEEIPSMRLTRLDDSNADSKYKPEDAELSPENIKSFVEDLLDGNLKPYLPSQELPEDWDKTPVKTLVQSNFDEVAFNKDKDVFIQFYAPWSQLCQQLAPIYDQLGEQYKDSETIVIAKIDATANELEHTKITSFPTFKLYTKGDNAVIDYYDVGSLEDFTKFLESLEEEEVDVGTEESVEENEASVDSDESIEEEDTPRDEL